MLWVCAAGGTAMDAGCYCAHSLRFFPGCSQPKVCCSAVRIGYRPVQFTDTQY